jgi:hypothetical protein
MGERWLLSWTSYGVVWVLSFPNSSGVRYFDQAWLRKATDSGAGNRGNIK